MCGICGFVGLNDQLLLKMMTDALWRRGPDEAGYYFGWQAVAHSFPVGLGIRRLKIIDLNTGSQPIYNENKDLVVVYNGEIYNFLELKENLEKQGHRFYTKTDTEVIVHLYEEYGCDCVKYLRGMFAFALWDSNKRTLFLSRDQIGIKPLYYAEFGGKLLFGSELKTILAYPQIPTKINYSALNLYLTHLYIPAPLTIFENIYKLLPGHFLLWQDGKIKIEKYWDLKIAASENSRLPDEKYYRQSFRELLQETIKSHLISDVPLGVFLSGGLDSLTLVALMSKLTSQPVKTFTIGYGKKDEDFNELRKAAEVAKYFGCAHNEYILEPKMIELLPELTNSFDEPFADSSALPTYLISKASRENVTVALTGVGGDELFGGYPRYLGAKVSLFYENLPRRLRQLLTKSANLLPETGGSRDWWGRSKRFLIAGNQSFPERYKSWVSFLTPELKNRLYTVELKKRLIAQDGFSESDFYDNFSLLKDKSLEAIFKVDLKTYLVDDLLCLADRMSMANSLELRVPFCDLKLVEFFAQVPFALKVKGLTLKYLLKKTLSDIVPREMLWQKKMGFMVPLKRWISEEMKPLIDEYLSERTIKGRGYFEVETVNRMLREHFSGRRNFADQIWSLLVLESWQRNYTEMAGRTALSNLPKISSVGSAGRSNILVVSDVIPFDREGGSGGVVWELSRCLAKRGNRVVILTRGAKGLPKKEFIEGIEVRRFGTNLFKCRKIFSELEQDYHFDLVLFNHPFSALGVNVSKNKIPALYFFYSPWPEEYLIRCRDLAKGYLKRKIGIWCRKFLEGRILGKVDKIVVLSRFMNERLENWHNLRQAANPLLPAGVDLQRFKPVAERAALRKKLGLPEDKFLLLTVRNLVSRMGLENLILAMPQLINICPDIFLVIGGNGYLEKKLKNLARKLNLESWINFTGYIPEKCLPEYYQTADLFVLPTKYLEGFGLITLEAMACGTPVLATPVGATPEILEKFDKNFLFNGTGPEAIAAGIKKFIEQKNNYPDLRKKCRKFVEENYSWDKFTDGVEKIFQALQEVSRH